MSQLSLARLLQLASPALPVGAYTYSQGLEWAGESGVIRDEASAGHWIADLLRHGIGCYEAPLLVALMRAWQAATPSRSPNSTTNSWPAANAPNCGRKRYRWAFRCAACSATCATSAWAIAPDAAVTAYLWSWAENQVMAALKAVPLGQAAGQRLLAQLAVHMPAVAVDAQKRPKTAWLNFAPGFTIACARHETQYSRLFRS